MMSLLVLFFHPYFSLSSLWTCPASTVQISPSLLWLCVLPIEQHTVHAVLTILLVVLVGCL